MRGLTKRQIILLAVGGICAVALLVAAIANLNGGLTLNMSPVATAVLVLLALSLPLLLSVYFLFTKTSALNNTNSRWFFSLTDKKKRQVLAFAIVVIAVALVCFLFILTLGEVDGRTKLVFSSVSSQKVYDGTPLCAEEFELLQGELEEGHSMTAVFFEGATNAGVTANSFVINIIDRDNQSVTNSYNIEYRLGSLTVLPYAITIKSDDAVKEYDGTALTNHSYTADEIIDGHSLTVTFSGERLDAGTSPNHFFAAIFEGEQDLTANYSIDRVYGSLEVLPRRINIATASAHKVYNGTPLKAASYNIVSTTQLAQGHSIEVVLESELTDVGTLKNSAQDVIIMSGDTEVTHNYNVVFSEGDLMVSPRTITIRSGSKSKIYDGTPLTFDEWSFSSLTRILDNHTITVIISGQRTALGASQNTIAEVMIFEGGVSVTHNYQIRLEFGTLAVTDASGNYATQFDEGGGGNGSFGSDDFGGNGSSGGGLDDSGKIGLPEGSGESEGYTVAEVKAYESGFMYLRFMSFGDFTGSSWLRANDYFRTIDGRFSFNYLNAFTLNTLFASGKVSIRPYTDGYLLPYYLDAVAYNYDIQVSDTIHSGNTTREYSLYAFLTDYLPQNPQYTVDGALDYQAFVEQNYLSVPYSSLSFMQNIITANNFSRSQPDIIDRVAKYIQNSAQYNLQYNRDLDKQSDIAVSFLRDYKEGVCQHYATAATMLFRALGIPARYTVGFVAETQKNAWSVVSSNGAHAWVEVFVEGLGWVKVEVTGGNDLLSDIVSGGGEGSGGEGSGGGGEQLRIKPLDRFMPYSLGAVLTPTDELQGLSALLSKGFTYQATVTGSQSAVGIGHSEITSFALFDEKGNDVTKNYSIIADSGILQLYLRELKVTTDSHVKVYDGVALQSSATALTVEGELLSGHSFKTLAVVGSQLRVGTSLNACAIEIIDRVGNDVTDSYKITADYGTLTVFAREITISAGSTSKVFDGTPLSYSQFTVASELDFAIFDDDTAVVTVTGSQTAIGRSPNTITDIVIYDKNGFPITDCYAITIEDGTLTVTPY